MILITYFMRRLGYSISFLWLSISVFMWFFLILQTAAKNDNDFWLAFLLAVLEMPNLMMDLLPFACALGAANTLRQMNEAHEIEVMRISGLSNKRTALLAGACALPFILVYAIISEFILEPSIHATQALKNVSESGRNIWIKDGNYYLQIGELKENGELADVVIYQTKGNKLNSIITAHHAEKNNEQWRLIDGNVLHFENPIREEKFTSRDWLVKLPSTSLAELKKRPRDMPVYRLAVVGKEIGDAGQNNSRFVAELWQRLVAIPLLAILTAASVCFLGHTLRQRVGSATLGALAISGGYFFAEKTAVQVAILYNTITLTLIPLFVLGLGVYYWVTKKD